MALNVEAYALALAGAKAYTDAVIASFPKGITLKGEVDYYSDLPSNPSEGDAYTVKYEGTSGTEPSGAEYAWGVNQATQTAQWIKLGIDLKSISGFDATKVQVLTNNLGSLAWAEGTTYSALNNAQYGGNE